VIDDALVAFVKTTGAFLKLIFTKEPKKREIQQDTHCISGALKKKFFFRKYFGTFTYKTESYTPTNALPYTIKY